MASLIRQSSSPVRFEQPPQGFRDKGYQSVLWNARERKPDDELRFSVYFRGENETGLETFEGKARTEILFLGQHRDGPMRLIT